MRRKAVVHGHCHHKSVLKFTEEEALLKKMGLDYSILDSGCCGMAGAFGYQTDHYDVGLQCGERVLLPAVRQAPSEAIILTDGFSCREQILQQTDRRALHLSQVLQMGLQPSTTELSYSEKNFEKKQTSHLPIPIAVGGAALLGVGLWAGLRRRY